MEVVETEKEKKKRKGGEVGGSRNEGRERVGAGGKGAPHATGQAPATLAEPTNRLYSDLLPIYLLPFT